MRQWLGYPSVQIALAVAIYLALGWKFGAFGLVIMAPGLAAAIARPVINLAGNIRQTVRERTWLPVHGTHFVFKDVTIHVLEDERHFRWVNLADARKVGGIHASEGALQSAYGQRLQRTGKPAQLWIRDDALIEYLARSTDAVALRFRTWIDRQVAMPAQKIRERLGVRDEAGQDKD